MIAESLFWLAVAVTVYVSVGYPLLLLILRARVRRPVVKRAIEPSVSLLVAAYNEDEVIEAKIRNALELDYPVDRLEIVIASDGSTDDTVKVAAAFQATGRVRVFDYPVNRGKLAVLNETVPHVHGEIVAFSDAASMLQPDALRKLVQSFADAHVGAVSGVYRVLQASSAALGHQEDLYWRYETLLRRCEAETSSVLGAHGALYAVRRHLYPFPTAGVINDDYVVPLRILQHGHRVAYETEAVACEEARHMQGFSRRIRIMTGNLDQLREIRALLHPVRPLPLLFFLSHKVGRLLVPLAMVAAAVANLWLLDTTLYRWTLGLQILFYACVGIGALGSLAPRVLRFPYYFCMVNAAAFVAVYNVLRGRRLVWKGR